MHGPRRVATFCLLTAVLPTVLIIIPLYLRHSVFADVHYEVAESDIFEIHEGISSIFCEEHTLSMNSTFNAYQLSTFPEISNSRKHIRLKKSMVLPDDTLEYWGFYLLKGSTVALKVCSRHDGSRILVVRGERNLRTCGLLNHNNNKPQMDKDHTQVKVTFETAAQEIQDSKEAPRGGIYSKKEQKIRPDSNTAAEDFRDDEEFSSLKSSGIKIDKTDVSKNYKSHRAQSGDVKVEVGKSDDAKSEIVQRNGVTKDASLKSDVNDEGLKSEILEEESPKSEIREDGGPKSGVVKEEVMKSEARKNRDQNGGSVKDGSLKSGVIIEEYLKSEAGEEKGRRSEAEKSGGQKGGSIKDGNLKREGVKEEGLKSEDVKEEGLKDEGLKSGALQEKNEKSVTVETEVPEDDFWSLTETEKADINFITEVLKKHIEEEKVKKRHGKKRRQEEEKELRRLQALKEDFTRGETQRKKREIDEKEVKDSSKNGGKKQPSWDRFKKEHSKKWSLQDSSENKKNGWEQKLRHLQKELEEDLPVREKRETGHKLDGAIEHGGNAINYTKPPSGESDSVSSFETTLLECYDGQILVNQGFPPSLQCTDVHFLARGDHMQMLHDVSSDGYYYYIFYSDNDLVSNDIHAVFDIHKPTFQYANISDSKQCVNDTECNFAVSFFSDETVIVEVPTRDGIDNEEDDITILVSTCKPRMAIYIIFPITILFLILACAFL